MQRCLPYSKPFFRWAARLSQSLKSQIPQALRPSCSSMCRLSVWTSWLAIWPPTSRPPTKARQPMSSLSTSAGDSRDPEPLSRVTGRSQRRISAADKVSAHTPPSVGVLAITASPARSWTSMAWTSTLRG